MCPGGKSPSRIIASEENCPLENCSPPPPPLGQLPPDNYTRGKLPPPMKIDHSP